MRNRLSPTRLRKRSPRLGIEGLEDRVVPAAILNITNAPTGLFPQFDLVDPNPNVGGLFGTQVLYLPSGNIVVTDPGDDAGGANAGAVYLFNGTTGALISTITGSHANDHVGINGVKALTNGNYAFVSIEWDNGTAVNAGAVTWGSGTTGVSGVVSAANSLVGSQTDDMVGDVGGGGSGLTVLPNGNYVVRTRFWDNGAVADAGAVTWGNGTTGISGPVNASNSLVGSTAGDRVGETVVKVLPNGNYIVSSPLWDNGTSVDAGAVTWADGSVGIRGPITSTNSLVGTTSGDQLGDGSFGSGNIGVQLLPNGNYVVVSPRWDNGVAINVGAVTWADGSVGIRGPVTSTNSLVGSTSGDQVGISAFQGSDLRGGGFKLLANGNYVVIAQNWHNGVAERAGAVTWGNSSVGIRGVISAANSLVGSQASDGVGNGDVQELRNGNYVVHSPNWSNGPNANAGALTWVNSTTGITGVVSAANSVVGSTTDDTVGGNGSVTELTNGNYVVSSVNWDNGAIVDAGAATWFDGTKAIRGPITAANSLVGTTAMDRVGYVATLKNGNYVVFSSDWDNGAIVDVGAVTLGNGTTGTLGTVSAANSLIGSSANNNVGSGGLFELKNGNYVVFSPDWDNGAAIDAGAVTWRSATAGISGVVSATNSLVGSTTNDKVGRQLNGVGETRLVELTNGNYVVQSYFWNNGDAASAGAFTWGSGTTGSSGVVSAANSLVGSHTGDALVPNGGFFLFRPPLDTASVVALTNGNYIVTWPDWDNGTIVDAGAATWGDGTKGISGTVSAANSLVGTTFEDFVGRGVTPLTNGNYVVNTPFWDDVTVRDAGAVTWGNGAIGIRGAVSITNSLVGSSNYDKVGSLPFIYGTETYIRGGSIEPLPNGNYTVRSPFWDNGGVFDPGVLTFGDGTKGIAGIITPANSLIGSQQINAAKTIIYGSPTLLISSLMEGSGRVIIGFRNANLLTFNFGGSRTLDVPPNMFAASLNAGQDVLSQATTTITVASPIVVDNPTGNGGALTLQSQDALNLNANITTDNGNLTLLGTTITPAVGVTVNTGTGTLNLPTGKLVLNQTLTLNGGTNLSGVSLTATLLPTIQGKSVTLIDKLSAGPIMGTFAGLAQGAQLTVGGADFTISYTGGDGNDTTLTRLSASVSVPALVGVPQFAAGSDVGGGSATLFNPDGSVRFAVTPFAGFSGGVRTATADFNGDGIADLIVGTGPGIATRVVILDGKTQAVLFDVAPFEATFTGGVYVSAGDVNGDGIPDLAITPDQGGGPRADVYSGATGFPKIASFFGIDDVNFRGGARSAIADMTGDGVADLIVVAGFGGGPRVAAFDGKSLSTGTPVKIFGDFFAFEQALRNGIFVTAGDINGDGFADLIAGGGPGGGPRVLVLDGKSLLSNQYVNLANFFGGDVNSRGGIRVAVKNLDGDTKADLVVGSGSGAGSRVTGYLGKNIAADGTPTTQFDFDSISGFTGGVFVG